MRMLIAAFTFLAALALPAAAQMQMDDMHDMQLGITPPPKNTGANAPSNKAFMDANMKMHHGMNIVYSGDADVDFVRGMSRVAGPPCGKTTSASGDSLATGSRQRPWENWTQVMFRSLNKSPVRQQGRRQLIAS